MRILLEEYRSVELARIAVESTLVIPVGSTEQHGPHLPVFTDAFMAQSVARAAAIEATSSHAPILVAPTLNYGASDHHLPRAGTISVTGTTYLAIMNDILESAVRSGFRRIIILNGHGGNEDIARQASRDAAVEHPVIIAAAGYWTIAWSRLVDLCTTYGLGPLPGHAGAFETSLMQHLTPDLVDIGTIRSTDVSEPTPSVHPLAMPAIESHGWVSKIDGYSNGARAASNLAGADLYNCIVQETIDFFKEFSHRSLPSLVVGSGRGN